MKKLDQERKLLQISTIRRSKQSVIMIQTKNNSQKTIVGHPRVWYKKKGAKDDFNICYGNYCNEKIFFSKTPSLENWEESKNFSSMS